MNKRSAAIKQKSRARKGQKLKDEHSMIQLNNNTEIHDIVRDTRGHVPPKPTREKESNLKILEDLERLAQKSVNEKKYNRKSKRASNPVDFASILSGLGGINVSNSLQLEQSANMHSGKITTKPQISEVTPITESPDADIEV